MVCMNGMAGRFGGIQRLFGEAGLARLRAAHVCVVGIGGVGSWCGEALARSGLGALTLVDLDDVCETNINRQLHALEATIGRPKVEVMAERVRGINPECHVTTHAEFFTETTAVTILTPQFSWVVDAIDAVANKCRLIAACRERGLRVISCGAAGGRTEATAVRIADLANVTHDRLLAEVRKRLRKDGVIPAANKKWDVPCVFSPETPVAPEPSCEPGGAGEGARLNCDFGYGSATFVTGTFGFAAAGYVVNQITSTS
jgi:tRNA A37 threonylcarbamoyladenosine dehydratase